MKESEILSVVLLKTRSLLISCANLMLTPHERS